LEEGLSCGVGSSSGESADEGEATLRGPSVVRGSARFQLGYESSGEESSEEVEHILGGTNMDESMGGRTSLRTRRDLSWRAEPGR
jgi:hypothetical protein